MIWLTFSRRKGWNGFPGTGSTGRQEWAGVGLESSATFCDALCRAGEPSATVPGGVIKCRHSIRKTENSPKKTTGTSAEGDAVSPADCGVEQASLGKAGIGALPFLI